MKFPTIQPSDVIILLLSHAARSNQFECLNEILSRRKVTTPEKLRKNVGGHQMVGSFPRWAEEMVRLDVVLSDQRGPLMRRRRRNWRMTGPSGRQLVDVD